MITSFLEQHSDIRHKLLIVAGVAMVLLPLFCANWQVFGEDIKVNPAAAADKSRSALVMTGHTVDVNILISDYDEYDTAVAIGLPNPAFGWKIYEISPAVFETVQESGLEFDESGGVMEYTLTLDNIQEDLISLASITDTGSVWYDKNADVDLPDLIQETVYVPRVGSAAPAGAVITKVEYYLKVQKNDSNSNFRCSDYYIAIANSNHYSERSTYCRVWNRWGGETDGGQDDDAENDQDIDLRWRTTLLFNGENPNQIWYLYIKDAASPNDGFLNYVYYTVYYELFKADLYDDGESDRWFWPQTVTEGKPNQNFLINCDIRNGGTVSSGSFVVKFYASINTTITSGDHYIGQVSMSSISAGLGGWAHCDWSGNFPTNIPDGSYYFGWIIDANNNVDELDEGNNTAYKEGYKLTVQPAADLYDDGEPSRSFFPQTVTEGRSGQSFEIHCDIRNGGGLASGSFAVYFLASTDATISPSDHYIGQVSMSSISAGGVAECDWGAYFPTSIPDGSYYVGWIIDAANSVDEVLENNNTAYKQDYKLTVLPANPIISGFIVTADITFVSNVPLVFSGLGTVTTDFAGYYSREVPYGYTGTVTPSASNAAFIPSSRSYSNVTSNKITSYRIIIFNAVIESGSDKVNDWFGFDGETPMVGDFNDDGLMDLITFTRGSMFSYQGDVYVTLSYGAGFSGNQKWHDWFAFDGETPMVGDFNGDGLSDIITFTRGSMSLGQGDVYIALSNGSTFVDPATKWHDWFAFDGETPMVGDFNGDGLSDIVTFTRGYQAYGQGDVYVGLSTGTFFRNTVKWHDWFAFSGEEPLVGDFNGDGIDDIGCALTNGQVYIAISDGTNMGPARLWVNDFATKGILRIGDMNGDGLDDLVRFNMGAPGDPEAGKVYVAYSLGTIFTEGKLFHNWFGLDGEVPMVADVNGDGKDDLIVFTTGSMALGQGDVYISLTPPIFLQP